MQFKYPAILNISHTKLTYYEWFLNTNTIFVITKRIHTSQNTKTSSYERFPRKFIADCVQNREIASCLTYKIHLKVIFLLILHGRIEYADVMSETQ